MFLKGFFFCFLLIAVVNASPAQTLPVGLLSNVEEAYRREQLLGNDTTKISYLIRPLSIHTAKDVTLGRQQNGTAIRLADFRKELYTSPQQQVAIYLLPLVTQQQFNSHHPYGLNDGAMVQAKGYQTQISGGVFIKAGPVALQLRPEYVFAENTSFQKLSEANEPIFRPVVADRLYNQIDLPDRFGDGHYSKVSWGQSSLSVNAGPIALSLSNENLWWGPGVRNALLMSNNASGFKHLSLNTDRPIKTYIGAFEAQIISGKLEQSGVASPLGAGFATKPRDWRYFSGLAFSYQPKWVAGLYLGFSKATTINSSDMGDNFISYFPVFRTFPKASYGSKEEASLKESVNQSQYFSWFARYVFPESKAEVYAEIGRNDAYDLAGPVIEPRHSLAYLVGFKKLIPLKNINEFIQVGMEFTQLEKPISNRVKAGPTWYTHGQVVDGYTHQGQVLGAGIGPGSNLQSFDVSWVKGFKKVGLRAERLVNNNDLFYSFADAMPVKPWSIIRHWVDLSVAGQFAWNFDKFIFNAEIAYVKSLNYQWQTPDYTGFSWTGPKTDVVNVHAKLGLMYSF